MRKHSGKADEQCCCYYSAGNNAHVHFDGHTHTTAASKVYAKFTELNSESRMNSDGRWATRGAAHDKINYIFGSRRTLLPLAIIRFDVNCLYVSYRIYILVYITYERVCGQDLLLGVKSSLPRCAWRAFEEEGLQAWIQTKFIMRVEPSIQCCLTINYAQRWTNLRRPRMTRSLALCRKGFRTDTVICEQTDMHDT